jgi:hypothetical protein
LYSFELDLLAPVLLWTLRSTLTVSPSLLTLRVPVAVCPLRPWAVVVRVDESPDVVRDVVPLLRELDQLLPPPLALCTEPREALPPPRAPPPPRRWA